MLHLLIAVELGHAQAAKRTTGSTIESDFIETASARAERTEAELDAGVLWLSDGAYPAAPIQRLLNRTVAAVSGGGDSGWR